MKHAGVFHCCFLLSGVWIRSCDATWSDSIRSFDDLDPVLVPWALALQDYVAEHSHVKRTRHVIEFFAGQAEISVAANNKGMSVVAYDRKYNMNSNINHFIRQEGFSRALELVLSVVPGGSLWGAPVCGPWVFICRKGTDRSLDNPAGNLKNPRVQNSNRMVVYLTIVFLLGWMRNLHLFIEQPRSSLMRHFTPFRELLKSCLPHETTSYLGHEDFGGESPKPITLHSDTERIAELKRKPPMSTTVRLASKSADGSVNGKTALLTSSSAYPRGFGRAVASLMKSLLTVAGTDCMFDLSYRTCFFKHILKRLQASCSG